MKVSLSIRNKTICLFILVVGTLKIACAQESDSTITVIKDVLQSSVKLSLGKHQNLRSVVSSMFITFSAEGKIEKIFFSDSPPGLVNKEKTLDSLKKKFNDLKIDAMAFSNTYIIVIIVVGHKDRIPTATTEMVENWPDLFSGIDFKKLSEKKIKYCLPLGIQYLGSIN